MIKIDVDTRCWKIPKEECFLGVESDDKVKILQFELSKNEFCDGLNFTDCNCFINYKNEGNDTIPYLINDMEVHEDGTVTFTWEVSRGATIFKGNTFAILCAKKVSDDGTITNEWNSRIGSFTVAKGIEPLSSITEVPEIDIISQLLLVAKNNIEQSNTLLEKAEGLGYLKDDFDVLEARMNQFTSLQEGSTTGDAELTDIRVGADGKTYPNAGESVRGQISELKSDIANYTPLTNKKVLKYGGYNLKTGRVVKDGSIQTLSGFSYVTLDVQSIKTITMQINSSGSSDLGYCFYNADESVNLFKATNYTKIETIEVPQGAMIFKYGKGDSLWSDTEIVLETNEDKTYEILYNKLLDSEGKIEDINNQQDNFYKKEISKTLSKDSDEVIETKDRILLADGTQSWTGVSGRNIYTVNNIENYSTITFKTVNVSSYGSNASSYAWLDSEGAVLKAVRCLANEIITVPIFENAKSIVIYSTDYFADGCILTSADDLADVKNSVDKTSQRLTEIEKTYIDGNPLGYMDNLFIDKWLGVGIYKSDDGNYKNTITKTYENEKLVSFKIATKYATSINDSVSVQGCSFFRIKKSVENREIRIALNNGATCVFNDYSVEEGTTLYQKGAVNPMKFGEIVRVTDDYIIFYTDCISEYKILSRVNDFNSELVIYPEYCGVFLDLVAKENINFDMKYKSRSMKINSTVRGRNAICFGDSLISWVLPLAIDYGMNVYVVAGGGHRMGYEGGSGAGGETGTADALWLCSDTRIQRFNTNFADLTDVDYIINMTGTNGTLSDISNVEELKFISANKRWWFDTSETNPFDGLSDESKARFTSQACYFMSFIKLIQRFPRAIPVVCSLYRYRNADNRTEDEIINYLYYDERGQKNEVLKQISDCLGGYYVDLEKCGCNVMSDGGDAVHPDYRHAIMASSEIVKTIDHLDYVGDKFS